MEMQERLLKLY